MKKTKIYYKKIRIRKFKNFTDTWIDILNNDKGVNGVYLIPVLGWIISLYVPYHAFIKWIFSYKVFYKKCIVIKEY